MAEVILLRAGAHDQVFGCGDLTVHHCSMLPPKLFCPLFCQCNRTYELDAKDIAELNEERCCQLLPDGEVRDECRSRSMSGDQSVDYHAILEPLGETYLRWWNTCIGGFNGCPTSCTIKTTVVNVD